MGICLGGVSGREVQRRRLMEGNEGRGKRKDVVKEIKIRGTWKRTVEVCTPRILIIAAGRSTATEVKKEPLTLHVNLMPIKAGGLCC